jgi:hypothetical protein
MFWNLFFELVIPSFLPYKVSSTSVLSFSLPAPSNLKGFRFQKFWRLLLFIFHHPISRLTLRCLNNKWARPDFRSRFPQGFFARGKKGLFELAAFSVLSTAVLVAQPSCACKGDVICGLLYFIVTKEVDHWTTGPQKQ